MTLLIAFVVCVLVGQAISVAFGLIVEYFTTPQAGLLAFLPLYFAVFGVAWKVSVHITEPSAVTSADTAAGPQASPVGEPQRGEAARKAQ